MNDKEEKDNSLDAENRRAIEEGRLGDLSDGTHTISQLYKFRMLYNAALFNLIASTGGVALKSRRHYDGELCFGGGWFIVEAYLPQGDGAAKQISNHYEEKYWDLFQIPERHVADEWDGHDSDDVLKRLDSYARRGVLETGDGVYHWMDLTDVRPSRGDRYLFAFEDGEVAEVMVNTVEKRAYGIVWDAVRRDGAPMTEDNAPVACAKWPRYNCGLGPSVRRPRKDGAGE